MYSYRIEQAIKAATILHKNQVRKGVIPMPYVSHLFAVAMIASEYAGENEDIIIGALLHDTLEDTDYTSEELQEDFGGKVREIVEALTEPADTDTKHYTWKEIKAQYAKQLRKAPQEALIIAAADKIHNMRCMVEEYFDEHARFLKEFSGALDDRLTQYQDIANALNRNLKSDILKEFNHVFTEYKNFILDVKKTKEAAERV
jgi:(p)ppGpp synthase/HD superfamily hydrolase